MDDALRINARHLYEVEGLSIRQVAVKLGIGRKKAARLLSSSDLKRRTPDSIIKPYERLIGEWYSEYPFLRATQAFERLKSYGYTGGYAAVKDYTVRYRRKKKKEAFHELEFLPGEERNSRIHRTTKKKPVDALSEERLKPLPGIPYKPYRCIPAHVTKTGFVDFETNRYSVPSSCSQMTGTILTYPEYIEIVIKDKRVASHKRSFGRQEKIENPSHRERILDRTNPEFKQRRIYQLMKGMDESIKLFLDRAEEEGEDILAASHTLFRLIRTNAKESLVSAVREAVTSNIYKVSYVQSLLQPGITVNNPVRPQNQGLLEINYEGRELSDYDKLI